MNSQGIGSLSSLPAVGCYQWRRQGMLHRHDGQPAHIELQGQRAVVLWAWADEWIAQLVLTDYEQLCLTVFAQRPAEARSFVGTIAVAEAMMAAGLVLSVGWPGLARSRLASWRRSLDGEREAPASIAALALHRRLVRPTLRLSLLRSWRLCRLCLCSTLSTRLSTCSRLLSCSCPRPRACRLSCR